MLERDDLARILATHKKTLTVLEEKAARYASSSIPVDLKLDLDEKRQEVERLEAELKEAEIAAQKQAKQTQQEAINSLGEMGYPSRMRSPVADEHYIERKAAKKLREDFAAALQQPNQHPFLFNLYGIGGVGKTTLLGRLQKVYGSEADFIEVCFSKTPGLETPLKLMRRLHQQAIALPNPQNSQSPQSPQSPPDRFDPFGHQEQLFEQTVFALGQQSPNGTEASNEETNKVRDWFERLIWLGTTAVSTSARTKTRPIEFQGTGLTALATLGDDRESLQDWIQQRVRNHPATQDQPSLQALMLHPRATLTQAFAASLLQIAQDRARPMVVVLDTYEKAQPYLGQWLWQYLVEDTALAAAPVRLLVVGRQRLERDEGWRKVHQDRNVLYSVQLETFDKTDTERYLDKIDITKGSRRNKIYKTTKGLPYYLNWVRRQAAGNSPDFSQGNQAIVELLLQGKSGEERQVLQVVACCRWFNRAIVRYLFGQPELDFGVESGQVQSLFDWLIQSDFVEFSQGQYRFDDVARDVFRQAFYQDDRSQFRKVCGVLAAYFEQEANELFGPETLLPEPYEDEEWRELKAEALYYGLFGSGKGGLRRYIEQVLIGAYLGKPDIFVAPFAYIQPEIDQESQKLISKETVKFFKKSAITLMFGWRFLDKIPGSYQIEFEDESITLDKRKEFLKEIETSIESFLGYLGILNDPLSQIIGQVCQSLRCNSGQIKATYLLKAKHNVDFLSNRCHSQLIYNLWRGIGRLLFRTTELYEESLACYEKALTFGEGDVKLFAVKGTVLFHLERYEEALENFQKGIDDDPEFAYCWRRKGATLLQLKYYQDAYINCQKAVELDSNSASNLTFYAITLSYLELNQEALEIFQKTIELIPEEGISWMNQGVCLADLGRYQESLESYCKAIELDPELVLTWDNLIDLFSQFDQYEEELKTLQESVNTSHSESTWINFAWFLQQLRRYRQALDIYQGRLKILSNHPEVLSVKALALSHIKEFDAALTSINRVIKLEPQEILNKVNLGIVLARSGQYTEALSECEIVIQQNPDHVGGYYAKACCYALQGEIEPALESLAKAIEIDSDQSRREAKYNPDFDRIRDEERFKNLVYPQPKN
jgi:tetratricopeptide (TPR) repeat protein